jgi:hypothetical protein
MHGQRRPSMGLGRCWLTRPVFTEFTMSLRVRQHLRSASALLIAALVVATPLSWAAPDHPDEFEPIGRIADLDGRLHLDRANGESFELAEGQRLRSMAVREGDRLRTGWNGRLVIEVGPNRLKLDERTELVVRRLEPGGVALDLERGSLVLDLRRPESAWRWQVDSAAGRHQPHGAGLFRIDAPDTRRGLDSGSATAWRSALRIENEDGTLLLPPGQRAERDRQGRWQLGYPQADAFAAWSMGPMDRFPPDDRDGRDDRPPRHWQAAPSWEFQPVRPPSPPPPRVIVVPAPIMVEPPPRHWHMRPEPRDQRPPQQFSPPVQPGRPMPPPDTAAPPPRPDRRHHEGAPLPPAAPSSSPALPRPQRAL